MAETASRSRVSLYIAFCFLLWVFVDLGTAGGFRLSYFSDHGPLLLAFYLGYPLIFAFLIFRLHWSGWRLLLATAVAIVVIEGVFTRNPWLVSFPLMLFGVPLAMCVYAPLTYFPLWIVRGEMGRHRGMAIFQSLVVLAVMFLSTFGASR